MNLLFLLKIYSLFIIRKFINDQVIERFEQLLLKQKEKQEELKNLKSNPEIETKYDEKSCDERFVDRILLHKQYQVCTHL